MTPTIGVKRRGQILDYDSAEKPRNASTMLSMNGKYPPISTTPPFVLRPSKGERRIFQQNRTMRLRVLQAPVTVDVTLQMKLLGAKLRGIFAKFFEALQPSLPTPPKQSLRLRRPGAKATEGSPHLHPRSKLRGIRRRRITSPLIFLIMLLSRRPPRCESA